MWHYLNRKAAAWEACLVLAPAAVVQKPSISTDLSTGIFLPGWGRNLKSFSLRAQSETMPCQFHLPQNHLGKACASRSSTAAKLKQRHWFLEYLQRMGTTAARCYRQQSTAHVRARTCSPPQALWLPWGSAASHMHTLTHTQLNVMHDGGKKIQKTGSYQRLKDILRVHWDPES